MNPYIWDTSDSEDFAELVYLTGAWEESLPQHETSHDTANCPHVDGWSVVFGSKKNFWRSIFFGGHIFRMLSFWCTIPLSHTEINQFNFSLRRHHNICGR